MRDLIVLILAWMLSPGVAMAGVSPVETEVKVGLACEDLGRFRELKSPKADHLTFFEKPGRPFQRAGVILRKRVGDHRDVSVKFRPKHPEGVPSGPNIEVEGDWTLKNRALTWSYKVEGSQFTPDQMAWLAALTPEKPDSRARVELESERWKWDQDREEIPGLSKDKVSFERWSKVRGAGGDCLALEVSVRIETARAEKAISALQAFVVSKGVRIQPALQENKTARVLDLLLGRAR